MSIRLTFETAALTQDGDWSVWVNRTTWKGSQSRTSIIGINSTDGY